MVLLIMVMVYVGLGISGREKMKKIWYKFGMKIIDNGCYVARNDEYVTDGICDGTNLEVYVVCAVHVFVASKKNVVSWIVLGTICNI